MSVHMSMHAVFEHDIAAYAGQHEAWSKAMDYMKKAVSQSPMDGQVLYDAGVASYRVKDFAQAQAYFHQAAHSASLPVDLQERSYFNEGNAHAQLHHYQEAIDCYERTLQLNSDNQQARDNLALMKKLLEQQQQQEEQKREQEQQQQEDKKDESQQTDNTTSSQDQKKQDHDDAQKDSDQQKDHSQGEQKDQQQDVQEDNEASQSSGNQEKKENKHNEQQSQQHHGSQGLQGTKNSASGPQNDSQVQAEHDDTRKPQPAEAWLDKVLSEREREDAALHKKLVKARVAGQSKGQQDARAHW